jgi:gliding motility-associated-like protein
LSSKSLYRLLVFLLLIFTGKGNLYASTEPLPVISSEKIKLIENKGQWDSKVLFKAAIPGGDLWITSKGFHYALIDQNQLNEHMHHKNAAETINAHNYTMMFEGGNTNITVRKGTPFSEYYNYFIGKDASKWASNCKAYEQIVLQNIYNGIDAEIIAENGFIKLNFIVKSFADPSKIKLKYTGQDDIDLKAGELHIETSVANIKEEAPVAYQNELPVSCNYTLKNSEVSFNIASYDHASTLIIDPNIIFSTFSGSVADNFGFTGTYDENGNAYAAGTVYSNGFPVTTGAYQLTFKGGFSNIHTSARDVGILKFSSNGKQLLYATYLGGSDNEQPHSTICNKAGDLYVFGSTFSTSFPTTPGVIDTTHNGNADIFISRFSPDGTILKNSTLWGGSKDDGINGQFSEAVDNYQDYNPLTYNYGDFYRGEIKLDKNESVFIASATQSGSGYPILNAFQSAFGGEQDGCVFKLSPDLKTLFFSSYIGGIGADAAYGIAFDDANNTILCGGTTSSTIGKNQGSLTYNGDVDAFVAKISPMGTNLQKLVYVGTSEYDQAYFVDIDAANNIYITGQTMSDSFLVKGPVYKNPKTKQFITVLTGDLDSIKLSTTFGSLVNFYPNISPSAFMVDACGRIYISGWGGAVNASFNGETLGTQGMPITSNAFQASTDGSDFYLAVFSKDLAKLEYGSFLGGWRSYEHVDGGTSRFDKMGVVYQSVCAGCTGLSDFPTTPGAYSRVNKGKTPGGRGGCNNALFKLSLNLSDRPPVIKDTLITIFATDTLNYVFDVLDPDGDSVTATIGGSAFSLTNNPATVTSVKMKDRVRFTLKWNTLCSHTTLGTLILNLTAIDNACIKPNGTTGQMKLVVVAPPPLAPPYPECLKTQNDSTILVKWKTPASLRYFKQYVIYKKLGAGAFKYVGAISNPNDTVLIDNTAFDHLVNNNYCYMIQTVNICDVVSVPSRVTCSLFQNDSLAPPFTYTDTTLFVIATDTISYTFEASSVDPQDSVFISAGGNILTSGRIISSSLEPGLGKVKYTFSWRSICDDIKRTDTFRYDLLIRNNECPRSRTQIAHVKVVVLPPPVDPSPIMKCTRSVDDKQTLVRWLKTTPGKYFSHYVLIRKNPDGTWTELTKVFNNDPFIFSDNTSIDNQTNNFCYTGFAVNVCDGHGDTAELSCTITKTVSTPKPVYIHATSVEKNKNISLTWEKSKEIDFLKYKITRDESTSGSYTYYSEKTDINDTTYLDENVKVQQNVYCYEIRQVNDCGIENPDAYSSCSILLKGVSAPFMHSLSWNDYYYWKQGVKDYAVMKQEPNESPIQIGSTKYKKTASRHEKLNIENGLYYYTIVASEYQSSFQSVSNTIELIQAPLLRVPNAFTPNGDNINDTWGTAPVFVKDYELRLYNRWGQLIFMTNDKHHAFKDEFLNDPATSDVFVYLVTYTGWDGSSHVQKGNVTLLK